MIAGVILFLQILMLLTGTVFACTRMDKNNMVMILPRWVKIFLSLSLVLSSWLIYVDGKNLLKIYSFMVFMGMMFSSIGDLIRAGIIKFGKGLLLGGLAFICAHIMYISAFILTASEMDFLIIGWGFYISIIFYQTIFWLGWFLYIGRKKFKYGVKMGLICYGSFLCIMASTAASLAWSIGGSGIIMGLGAFFFFISDILIGLVDFGGVQIKYRNIWVWITYILGQIGIIYMPYIMILTK